VQGRAPFAAARRFTESRWDLALWDVFSSGKENKDKQAKVLYDRSIKYFEGKLYNRALKDLEDAITLNPEYGKEAVELMQMFSSQGADEQAVSVGYALLKLDKTNIELANKLGNSLRKLGSFDKAKRLYTFALKAKPNFADAKYNLAACSFKITTADEQLMRQTRKVEAFKLPRRFEFQGSRAGFYEVPNEKLEEDKPKAKAKGKEAEEQEPEKQMSEEDLAMMRDGMVKELKADLDAHPGSWEHEFNSGLLYDLFGFGELAIQHYRIAVEIDPKNRMSANNLAVALSVHKNQDAEAESLLLNGMSSLPFERTMVMNLALIYRKMNKGFQTLKYFVYLGELLARSLGEFETDKVEEHARQMFERRKYLEAIPIFENLATERQQAFWLEKLAVMYVNQKKEEMVVGTYKRLLRLDPNHKEAAAKLKDMADNYEGQAREKAKKGSRSQAIQFMLKSVQIVETPDRWVELAQWYEEEGEEILSENALKRWKRLTGADAGEPAPPAGQEAGPPPPV
jgi:tetratricopeptide (TPR) repeat protein